MARRPRGTSVTYTLLPYPTFFRSGLEEAGLRRGQGGQGSPERLTPLSPSALPTGNIAGRPCQRKQPRNSRAAAPAAALWVARARQCGEDAKSAQRRLRKVIDQRGTSIAAMLCSQSLRTSPCI